MLIISRKIGERVMIGQNIVITVCDVDSNKAKIGINAPKEIRIMRTELLEGEQNEACPNER